MTVERNIGGVQYSRAGPVIYGLRHNGTSHGIRRMYLNNGYADLSDFSTFDGQNSAYSGAFDKAGNFYIANYTTDYITKTTPAGVTSLTWIKVGANYAPARIIFNPSDNNLYIFNNGSTYISRCTLTPTMTNRWLNFGTQPNITSYVLDSSNNMFIHDNGTGNIFKLTTAGSLTTFYNPGVVCNGMLSIDTSDNIYFIRRNSTIYPLIKITSGGTGTQWGYISNTTVQALAVDNATGYVYTVHADNTGQGLPSWIDKWTGVGARTSPWVTLTGFSGYDVYGGQTTTAIFDGYLYLFCGAAGGFPYALLKINLTTGAFSQVTPDLGGGNPTRAHWAGQLFVPGA